MPLRRGLAVILRFRGRLGRPLLSDDFLRVATSCDQSRPRRLGGGNKLSPLPAVEIAGLPEIALNRISPPACYERFRRILRKDWGSWNPQRVGIDLGINSVLENVSPVPRRSPTDIWRPLRPVIISLSPVIRRQGVVPPTLSGRIGWISQNVFRFWEEGIRLRRHFARMPVAVLRLTAH